MSDPLSFTASVVAILQFSTSVISFISAAKGSHNDRIRILAEIASTQGILYSLKGKVEKAQCGDGIEETMASLGVPEGPLDQFKNALECLASKLEPAEGLKKVGKSLIWPFQKEDIKEILSTIERLKSIFLLALTNDQRQGPSY